MIFKQKQSRFNIGPNSDRSATQKIFKQKQSRFNIGPNSDRSATQKIFKQKQSRFNIGPNSDRSATQKIFKQKQSRFNIGPNSDRSATQKIFKQKQSRFNIGPNFDTDLENSNPNFKHDASAYDHISPYIYLFMVTKGSAIQKISKQTLTEILNRCCDHDTILQRFHNYYISIIILHYVSFHCDRDHSIPNFPHDTAAHSDALPH